MIFAVFDLICFYWMGRIQLAESVLRRQRIISAAASPWWQSQSYSKIKPYFHIWFHRKSDPQLLETCPGSSKPGQEFSVLHKLIFKLWYFSLEGREGALLVCGCACLFWPNRVFLLSAALLICKLPSITTSVSFKKELISHVKGNKQEPSTQRAAEWKRSPWQQCY